MKQLSFLLLLTVLLSCEKESGNEPADTFETHKDVAYGTDAQQKMDIYLPANRSTSSTPVMILIHGGAWSTGDKSEFDRYVDTLKRRVPHYAIFNLNYRLATPSSNFFPTQEQDIQAAFNFIVSKLAEYRVSGKIVLLGASAGGHLALLQGYKNTSPVKAKAIVDFFGPTDMADMYTNPLNPMYTGMIQTLFNGNTPASNPTMYANASPIGFVTPDSPPTIILQGGLDPLVAVSQSTSLDARLQSKGVTRQYVFYPLEGHGWEGANLKHSFDAIQAFLATHVN